VAYVRVQQTSSVVLTHTFEVDEVGTDASGPVTWALFHADGTAVTPGGTGTAASAGAGTGRYTMTFNAPPAPDLYTLAWTGTFGGVPVTAIDTVETVGGYMFGIAEARAALAATMGGNNAAKYPTSLLVDKRMVVEQEAEDIAGGSIGCFAFVPRFARVQVPGNNTTELGVPHLPIRKLRSVSIFGNQFSAAQLADVKFGEAGVLSYLGGWIWGFGARNITIEYEFGTDSPPLYVRDAGIRRLQQVCSAPSAMIPTNAIQWTTQEGGIYRLASPGVQSTGYLDIDAAYQRAGYSGPF
jgi:hypothetical protein